MKNIKLLIILATLIGSSSCKKFFDVNPRTEVPKHVLFEKESGFQDALAGVYIQLAEDNAYGSAMTMTTVEHLVSSWDVSTNTGPYWLGLFEYNNASVEAATNSIYRQLYKIVASANEILAYIDNKRDVFSPGMYEMIKGECLAIRAYCHLDILRLFGPVPTEPSKGNQLPYVKAVTKTQNQLLNFESFKTELLRDLQDAEALLVDVDPFLNHSISDFQSGAFKPENEFANYRYLRMNYYAVKALKARAYLWFQESDKAYENAKALIDAKNPNGTPKFRLGTGTDISARNYVLTPEHIFGLYDFKLAAKYARMFASGNTRKGSNDILIREQLYGNTGTDIREANLWEVLTISSISSYVLKKYQGAETGSQPALDYNQIPMIRISEMYLIAAETAPYTQAEIFWNDFKLTRNFIGEDLPEDVTQRQALLVKEYRKEFYGEGQSFFAYKRINAPKTDILFVPPTATVNYLPPMPKIETTITK